MNNDDYDQLYAESGYVGRQYGRENASTEALCSFMKESFPPEVAFTLLDAGCGDGAVLNSILHRFPCAKVSGFDCSSKMINYAKSRMQRDAHLAIGDIFNIQGFSKEMYDVVISIHTLSLLDDFESALAQLMRHAKRYVYLNSLFSSHDIDVKAVVYEPNQPPVAWNIWSIARVTQFAKNSGGKDIEFRPFNMPYELPLQKKGTGSYTQRMANGELLTFTGPLALPWHLVRIDMT